LIQFANTQGKTVQIVTFLGNIIKNWEAFPVLIVVPNSTITNWVREFERWAPLLRVVPYYGEAKAREVISQFELRHEHKAPGTTGAKFHVLITAYQCITSPKDFNSVFKAQPRWEVLVVDEGQRRKIESLQTSFWLTPLVNPTVKSDSNVLFKKLNELKTIHRIIMTGVSGCHVYTIVAHFLPLDSAQQ
jgi:chromodomain-helicase-DNA-binding protein 4